MNKKSFTFILLLFSATLFAQVDKQVDKVEIRENSDGIKLVVNGDDFMINGMNWDYFPIGTNYSYSLWKLPEDKIKAALHAEMSLLKHMGVNVIRQYTGVPAKWITYIYENYGIYTMLNHSFGRYGLTLNGLWAPNTQYSDPATRKMLLGEVTEMVREYKDTPGLLIFLLGNENNYGLFWEGAETEDIPMEDRQTTHHAEYMYSLFEEATVAMKEIDKNHLVAICNGDLLFLDIIARRCKTVDILGINCYRGKTFTDLFDRVKNEYGKPVMFAEFGSDAFNAITNAEDQQAQAEIVVENWKDIYKNAAGMGKAGNAIGGFTFQFSDGWWKFGQTINLEVHDDNASWGNGGYLFDFRHGENNMNEEWFGICAKGQTDRDGLYLLYPRAAYYALKEVHRINPYAAGASPLSLEKDFAAINSIAGVLLARGDKAALEGEKTKRVRLNTLRAEFTTFNTGGNMIATPDKKSDDYTTYPNFKGFNHQESFFIGGEARPSERVVASVIFNVLGAVAENPIDEIFYENRGRSQTAVIQGKEVELSAMERFKVYRADFNWTGQIANVNGFYRTGHYHWGYEGDFFGLYPEANYGPNIDIYDGSAPFGAEFEGKKQLGGWKVAAGPQLWWGANPAVLVKYSKQIGKMNISGMYHEDVSKLTETNSSFAIPVPMNRRATLAMKWKLGKAVGIEAGGIWSGQPQTGKTFQIVEGGPGSYKVYQDQIQAKDTWGAKGKITFSKGRINWYAQGAAMGLVASGGADRTITFTGWKLKDSGSGNQYNFLTGLTYTIGYFQIAPNFLWQKPIVGPVPYGVQAPGRPRNIIDDPFAVRSNRETTAAELLLSFDPTPATWMHEWDNDVAEDAPFAASIDFIFKRHPTTQDAAIGISANRNIIAFPGATPARDLWETNARIVSKINRNFGFISNIYFGTAEPNGSDQRLVNRFGADLRMIYKTVKLTSMVKVNDWGPYDYHRDYNLTYPLQLMVDLSTTPGNQKWFDLPDTRVGIRGTWRSLNRYSPRYAPAYTVNSAGDYVADPTAVGFGHGNEWEIRTYIHFSIGK